jgi:inner membrane protein
MENLTHSFVGIAASKAGLERLSPATTALSFIAASAPDADIVTVFFGDRWTYLQHHRGITHSIVGTLAIALALPLIFYLVDRGIALAKRRKPKIRLKGLILASLIVSATHPLMDWTNNYGVRPFLPWSAKWIYGDLVFIVDPYIWFFIGGAAFLLTSKSKKQLAIWIFLAAVISYLVFFAVGPRPGVDNLAWIRLLWSIELVTVVVLFNLKIAQRLGPKIAIGAFVILVGYWVSLAVVHRIALQQVTTHAVSIAEENSESLTDVAAMPTLANPFRWQVVVETDRAAYRFDHFLFGERDVDDTQLVRHPRPEALASWAVTEAIETRPAKVFLDFARFPVANVVGEDCTTQTLVQLADLRYTEPGGQRGTFRLSIPVDCPTNSRQTMP